MKYFVTLLFLTVVKANKNNIVDSDPNYNCYNCEPQQIHIAFGGKYIC